MILKVQSVLAGEETTTCSDTIAWAQETQSATAQTHQLTMITDRMQITQSEE